MSITIADFWSLAVQSQLIDGHEVAKLTESFQKVQPGSTKVEELVKWLMTVKLSAYQAKVLMAGRPGPFVYGDYTIYERIESGRMAGIFRAFHRSTGHKVCLFFLSGEAVRDQATIARLQQQTAATNRASVGHPHLMRCYHLVDNGGYKFIVLEDISGKRVERLLATDGALAVSEACRIIRQAALGLGRMHGMSQVHDAVRPAHIWVEANRNVKLLTFPLTHDPLTIEPPIQQQLQHPGKLPAQADYLAPELIAQSTPDARSDIYSLGCSLYHMLSGQPPFEGGDLKQKLERHQYEKPKLLHELNTKVPPGLSKVVQYMLQKDPELRYQATNSVVEAILPFMTQADAQTMPDPPTAREQQYEAWLKHVPAAAASAEPAPIERPAPAQPAAPVYQAAAPHVPMATAMPTAGIPSAMAYPTASQYPTAGQFPTAGQYPTAVGAPVMAAPMTATPMSASPAYAAPMGAAQAMAAPASAFPGFNPHGPQSLPSEAASTGVTATRTRHRRSSSMPMIIGLVLLVGGGAAAYYSGLLSKLTGGKPVVANSTGTNGVSPGKAPVIDPNKAAGNKTIDNKAATPNVPTAKNAKEAVEALSPATADDLREKIHPLKDPVWESPTKGTPLDAKYLAPGAQAIISLRYAELRKHSEGEKLLDSVVTGGLGDWLRDGLPKSIGLAGDKIEHVTISLLDGSAGPPKAAYRIRTTEPIASEALIAAWGNPEPKMAMNNAYYAKDGIAYYLPASGEQRVMVIGPEPELTDTIATDGAATALPLELEVMLKQSDSARTLSVLFVPRVLLAAGKPNFPGVSHLFREPIETFLLAGDGSGELPKAVLASLHLGDMMFLETRIYDQFAGPQSDSSAVTIETRIQQLPRQIRGYLLSFGLSTYSRPLLQDYEDLLRQLQTYTRVGVAEKQVVARAYLPINATHNLALNTYLATIENPLSGYSGTGAAAPAVGKPTEVANDAAGKLKKVTSLSFDRNPFETAINVLADDIKVPMTIRGSDLMTDGITKNVSFGMAEENKPAIEILKTIMLKANPAGKLIYVIVKNPAGEEEIYITTRVAAATNKWKIPEDMVQK